MGAVYLAQQSRPTRTVAVKVLIPASGLDLEEQRIFLERFRREADTVAKLEHNNILPIYEYEEALVKYFKLKAGELPRFDLLLAGMGNEGHTLSLFPGTKALHADGRIAVHNWVGKLFTERITLTAPAACAASEILFMVTGGDKALALKGVLEGPYEPEQLPAQLVHPVKGRLWWLLDKAAAKFLGKEIRESPVS